MKRKMSTIFGFNQIQFEGFYIANANEQHKESRILISPVSVGKDRPITGHGPINGLILKSHWNQTRLMKKRIFFLIKNQKRILIKRILILIHNQKRGNQMIRTMILMSPVL